MKPPALKYNQDDDARGTSPQAVTVCFEFSPSPAIAVCVVNAGHEGPPDAPVPDESPIAFRDRNAMLNLAQAPEAVHFGAGIFSEKRKSKERTKL